MSLSEHQKCAKPTLGSPRHRTTFTPQQRAVLEDVFGKTRYPDRRTLEKLMSTLNLEESVLKSWFSNHRVRWKKQQQQAQSGQAPEDLGQVVPVEEEEEETPLLTTDANALPVGTRSYACKPCPPQQHDSGKPAGAGACVWNSSRDSETHDVLEINLDVLSPPWAAVPCDIEEFVELYALPGDDDPSSLDQYLSPKVPLPREQS